jgi:hypothetical protein
MPGRFVEYQIIKTPFGGYRRRHLFLPVLRLEMRPIVLDPVYYIYENWVAEGHRARIHRNTCSYCRDGKGVHAHSGTQNGRWHGPFPTVDAAQQVADATGGNVSRCKRCSPQ